MTAPRTSWLQRQFYCMWTFVSCRGFIIGIWIIRYSQSYYQFSKCTIRDMPLKAILTSLVNMQGLTDSASLEMITIIPVTVGAITDLKLFGWCSCNKKCHASRPWMSCLSFVIPTNCHENLPRKSTQRDYPCNSSIKLSWNWSSKISLKITHSHVLAFFTQNF